MPQPLSSQKKVDLIKAGATQTETSLLKQYVAGERVDLLDDYDFPARTITETESSILLFFGKKVTMFSWVRLLNGAGASSVIREKIASWRMFTLFSAVHSLLCEDQRSMVLWRRWPTASLSSSQPKLLRGAATATPCKLRYAYGFLFFCLHARCNMRVYPHSASQWKRHTRPVVASRLEHAPTAFS